MLSLLLPLCLKQFKASALNHPQFNQVSMSATLGFAPMSTMTPVTLQLTALHPPPWSQNLCSWPCISLPIGMDILSRTPRVLVNTLHRLHDLHLQLSPLQILWMRGRVSIPSAILLWSVLLLTHCVLRLQLTFPLLQLTKSPLSLRPIWIRGRQFLQLHHLPS